ncbi:Hypothetical protein CB129slpB_1733 [Propionibacterium freudenreichii]|nr:Hypothetical protein CB129slpB_1733 [Propionibacterium freudenreichii]
MPGPHQGLGFVFVVLDVIVDDAACDHGHQPPCDHLGAEDHPGGGATTAAQPAVPPEYQSAAEKAASYAGSMMHMSKQGVYDQLVSEYGEQFSAPAAQYAIDNVKADWNANALAAAKSYQSTLNMSPAAIHDQLTSSYGGKFTQAEADYALAHLND